MSGYSVILADPPWWYANRKTGGAQKHYPLMKDQELLDMRPFVDTLAAENCALFMWATYPRLDFGIDLLKAWGFRYATTAFTWVKTRPYALVMPIYGPGFYTASNPEIVLLGIRGSMPPVRKMTPSVILYPRMEHSRKPNIHPEIDAMYPAAKKIEMFARRPYEGWDAWGNQVETSVEAV